MNAGERSEARLAALERVADAASALVVTVGLSNPSIVRQPHRALKELMSALAALAATDRREPAESAEEGEIIETRYVGPRVARLGWLHVVRGQRTACDLPIQPTWVDCDPTSRVLCRACVRREEAGRAAE